jgi:hypothetical protein
MSAPTGNGNGNANGPSRKRPPPATSFSTAADQSQYNADSTKEGPFKTGLQLEANITRGFNGSSFTFVGSQVPIPVPHSTTVSSKTRIPDLLVRSNSGGLHMVDIKSGGSIESSVDQLKDLSEVSQHGGNQLSSLRVATATGSKNTDVLSLMKVHNHSKGKHGLPVLVRTNSMNSDQFVTVPELAQRKKQKTGPAPVRPGPASAVPTHSHVAPTTSFAPTSHLAATSSTFAPMGTSGPPAPVTHAPSPHHIGFAPSSHLVSTTPVVPPSPSLSGPRASTHGSSGSVRPVPVPLSKPGPSPTGPGGTGKHK